MTIRHVNLLDVEASGPGQTELNYLGIIIVTALIICIFSGFAIWKKYQYANLTIQVDSLTLEVNKLNAASSSTKPKSASKDLISKLNNPISWSKLLKHASNMIPQSIEISQLTGSLTSPRSLVLIGYSQIPQNILALKDRLQSIPECDTTSLTSFTRTTFTLECHIR